MDTQKIKSAAFQNEELRSERLRIFGVLSFIVLFIAITAVRLFVIRTASIAAPWEWSFLLGAAVIAYEVWILHKVNNALKFNSILPVQFWISSTILETSIPAFAIALSAKTQPNAVYPLLTSPAVLTYFIFIVLSTLRLNSWICALSGTVASTTYLFAAWHLGWKPPAPGIPAPITQSNISLNAIILFAGGLVAAGVAGQIRKHVQAALREAETKQKLDAIQHDLQIARSIQQSLLPQEPPQIEGFDIAGWNRPADDTGGDYFDWKILSDGKVVISLADVTGHGIGPALLATACHAYARSNFRVGQELPAAVEHLNQELGADLTSGRFVTFVAAICSPDCPEMEMLSAGHGPLFIYSRPDDHFTELDAHALPLGILPSFTSTPSTRLQLHAGDLVLLATDGFFEWENNQGEQFGIQRMEDVIRASRDVASSEIIARLYDAVITFSNGTKQQDDLTAVIIKRL